VPALLLWVSGFFFAMLWFMLMADTRANGITAPVIPADILDSIRTFYIVIFGPMTWFVKIVFALGLLCMILQLFIPEIPRAIRWIVFLTNAPPIFMAALYIIPMVDRFITNTESLEVQSQYVRTVLNAHLLAASCVALMIVLQLFIVMRLRREQ
jgi:uncharacterized membrane protein YcgQ (UPF0703/DUF1980 family)